MSPLTSASGEPSQMRVRLRRPAEFAAATPYLLGFHPAESVIAVSVRGRHNRLGLLIRTDLPPPDEEASRAVAIAEYLRSDNADAALVVVHTEEADRAAPHPADGRVRQHLVEALDQALSGAGIRLSQALLVRDGRWSSYLCRDPVCCPAEGNPVDAEVGELAAASALSGHVVLSSRADLVRSIEPIGGADSAAVGVAVDKALSRLSRHRADGAGVVGAELDARQAAWRGQSTRAGPDLPPDRVAELVVALTDQRTRDAALARCVGEHAEAFEALWLELVRRTPPPLDAAPATLLAVTAYARGDGAFAGVCLDRALTSYPGYPLAELVRAALSQAVPPASVAAAIRAEAVGMRGP